MSRRRYPFRLPLKRSQLEAIGHVTVQWAFLETEIDLNIQDILARLEQKGRVVNRDEVYMKRTFLNRVAQLRQLGNEYFHDPEWSRELGKMLDTALRLKPDRDLAVHGRWGAKVRRGELTSEAISADKFHFDAEHPIESRDYPSKKLRRIAVELSRLNRDFYVFGMKHFRGVMPSSPGTYDLLSN